MPRIRRLPQFVAIVTALGGCADERPSPAIGLAYNWGDTAGVAYFQRKVDATRPPGGEKIRVVLSTVSAYGTAITSPLGAEVARAAAFVDDPSVVVVVGPGGSREALQVAPVFRDAKVVNLVPTATSRLLSTVSAWTFVLVPNDSMQGEFLGAFADTALHAKRAAILYVPDEYGIGLAAGTEAALTARRVALLDRVPMRLTLDCLGAGDAFYRDLVAQLARRGTPDVVIIAARTVETACVARALHVRWPRMPVLSGDGTAVEERFFERIGDAAPNMYLVAFWNESLTDSVSRDFATGFPLAVGRVVRHTDAVFYDAVMLAAAAIRDVGGDRAAIHDYMTQLGESRPSFAGIAGPIDFSRGARRPLMMTRIRGRRTVPVGAP